MFKSSAYADNGTDFSDLAQEILWYFQIIKMIWHANVKMEEI